MEEKIVVLGLMSGSSLDGVDLALCEFSGNNFKTWKILKGQTIEYSNELFNTLFNAQNLSAKDFVILDTQIADFYAQIINEFLSSENILPNFIASHGHTIFHDISNKITAQIGNGGAIAAQTNLPVVCDFRRTDVALGGQGAPLVPVGDRDLFGEYDVCINLGGIINITFKGENNTVYAYDICAGNQVLNYFARKKDLDFDREGLLAANGLPIFELLEKLNQLEFLDEAPPKSLDKFWIHELVIPLLESYNKPVEDILCTACHHIALQISKNLPKNIKNPNILLSGGGAFNSYLVGLIKNYCKGSVYIPNDDLINFKEALIFAYLGLLRWKNVHNTLKEVTGAKRTSCSGAIYFP
jgi:anhydro-N-acetylmuramic acid kinase